MSGLVIATSRYFAKAEILESGLVSVGVTVGAPRFPLGFELGGNVGMLAPYGLRQIEDRDEFEAAYRARLDRFGPEKIARLLHAIAHGHDAPGVVLLCFEDLTQDGQWCHRSTFASWWQEQTGEEVREL